MSIALFFVLAILVAAAVAQPLLPASRVSYPLPGSRSQRRSAQSSPASGRPQGPTCPSCGVAVMPGDSFCVGCGGVLVVRGATCPACGVPMAEDDQFCRKCGARLGAGEGQP